MNYPLTLNWSTREQGQAWWTEGYTKEELLKLERECDSLEKGRGQIGSNDQGEVLQKMRACSVAWVPMNEQFDWLYQRIGEHVAKLNSDYFGFDLYGLEQLQYTVYEGGASPEHYDWHIDAMGKANRPQRKLSYVLQLSEPHDYEGGELWLHGQCKEIIPKRKGYAVMFPSYTLHRVTPVTNGLRKSLVAWATGPQFR